MDRISAPGASIRQWTSSAEHTLLRVPVTFLKLATSQEPALRTKMPALLPDVDPDGLLEYSVVYTDRALNHMSQSFQQTMRELSEVLKQVYNARSAIVVPGSGTFGSGATVALRCARWVLIISPAEGPGLLPTAASPPDDGRFASGFGVFTRIFSIFSALANRLSGR